MLGPGTRKEKAMKRLPPDKGMVHYLVAGIRPDIARNIEQTGTIETIVVGLGAQGTRHAGLMQDFGTNITAGIAPGRGGTRIHETIPVYDTVKDCIDEHPNIAAASIWRHYSTARDAAVEVIESGIPIVVLISEGVPLRDVRDILVAARRKNTLLLGGNTPGVIFPPEGIKIGMLPDVFYPEETSPGVFGPHGVTIVSRSGAILYHMSDALANNGIAQNAVLGIGGDGAIGSTFRELVPLVMGYENTDLVVVAGEIGGSMEELLARDIKERPSVYAKPLVAIISGAHAPEGKTMGHAGAIVSPGQPYGTFESKKAALEAAGVSVVNSQFDLIDVVKSKLKGRTYFQIDRYHQKMKETWEARPPKPGWGTLVTKVVPNNLLISGYPLKDLIEKATFLETAHLLVKGELPSKSILKEHGQRAFEASKIEAPSLHWLESDDVSKTLASFLLVDEHVAKFPQGGKDGPVNKTIFTIGRFARYLAKRLGSESALNKATADEPFSSIIYRVITGKSDPQPKIARTLEAMIVASVDHGVTPPSAQATVIAASTRAAYEVAVAHGIGAITDVHGGAGAKAAEFFKNCVAKSRKEGLPIEEATKALMAEYIKAGKRIEGLGHRVHTEDPRRDSLWKMAQDAGVAKDCVSASKVASRAFEKVRGMSLPINVDGVIGAIVADMGLDASIAKALFIYGRVAGLSAHYFEEVASQPQMRRINFADAVYKGKEERPLP
jgi:succinyl-CoA synthetase alpha subunit